MFIIWTLNLTRLDFERSRDRTGNPNHWCPDYTARPPLFHRFYCLFIYFIFISIQNQNLSLYPNSHSTTSIFLIVCHMVLHEKHQKIRTIWKPSFKMQLITKKTWRLLVHVIPFPTSLSPMVLSLRWISRSAVDISILLRWSKFILFIRQIHIARPSQNLILS